MRKSLHKALPARSQAVVPLVLLLLLLLSVPASAFNFDVSQDIKGSWDNTVKFSTMYRIAKPDDNLLNEVTQMNSDDGDRNFSRSWTSIRFDLLSEVDLKYRDSVGVRVSAAGWYDPRYYNMRTNNDSPGTYNSVSASDNHQFADGTRDLMGLNADLLDAFIWVKQDFGEKLLTLRAGKHTVLWGETLFNGTNGIFYGQAPMDLIKLAGVPSTQAKELFMPVNQISGQLQVLDNLSFAAYYQLEWRKSRMPASGSYFCATDFADAGGERLYGMIAPGVFIPLDRRDDVEADNLGQWGLAARFRALETEFGIYYLQYHAKLPEAYAYAGAPNTYRLVFPENIKALGVSFGTQIGPVNVSGETHLRWNMPLLTQHSAMVTPGMLAGNDDNPLYPTGDTWHANLSATYSMGPTFISRSAMFLGEVSADHVLRYTRNQSSVDHSKFRSAWGFRMTYQPTYFQVLDGLDIDVPLGLGYNPRGLSQITPGFNGGANEGGDFSVGISGTYRVVWKAGITYTQYFGSNATQAAADRDNVSFQIQRTF